MGIQFNGTNISGVVTNNTSLAKVACNGITVWEPNLYLYHNGSEETAISGGIIPTSGAWFGHGRTEDDGWYGEAKITRDSGHMTIAGIASHYTSARTKNKINLAPYSKLRVKAYIANSSMFSIGFTTSTTTSKGVVEPHRDIENQGWQTHEFTIDCSAINQSCYICMTFSGTCSIDLYSLVLEK